MTDALFGTTMELKTAFDMAIAVYDLAMLDLSPGIDEMSQTKTRLEIATNNFHQALYETLEPITDWNEQNNIYEAIKRLIDNDRMFGDEFRGDRYNQIAKSAPAGLDGFRVIQFAPALKEACSWYNDDRYRLRGFRLWYERYVLKLPTKYPELRQCALVQAVSSQPASSNRLTSNDDKSTEPIAQFIIKDEEKVLKFIDDELSRCDKPQGKLVAMLIIALCDGGYFAHHSGKVTAMINAFKGAYPGKVATSRGIEDYIRGHYNPDGNNPKRITDIELELLKNKLN